MKNVRDRGIPASPKDIMKVNGEPGGDRTHGLMVKGHLLYR